MSNFFKVVGFIVGACYLVKYYYWSVLPGLMRRISIAFPLAATAKVISSGFNMRILFV